MVFDVETTGLFPYQRDLDPDTTAPYFCKRKREYESLVKDLPVPMYPTRYKKIMDLPSEKWPYITQLSFIVVKVNKKSAATDCLQSKRGSRFTTDSDWIPNFEIVFIFNQYIQLPDHVEVTPFITGLTGVTKDLCAAGMPCEEALLIFAKWYLKCSVVVAHNIAFDNTMIRLEITRHYDYLRTKLPFISVIFNANSDVTMGVEFFDTMIRTIKLCGILVPNKTQLGFHNKVPKLTELYEILFKQTPSLTGALPSSSLLPQNLHNSIVDTWVCLRCFVKLKYRQDIDNRYFDQMSRDLVSANQPARTVGPIVLHQWHETANTIPLFTIYEEE
jgi:DNA polymerase III epsilon subunit-like protein